MMEINICSLEPLSDVAKNLVETETGKHIQEIRRESLADIEPCDFNVLICRDRDDWTNIFRALPKLQFVFILSVGVEKLPFDELRERSIVVANPKGLNAPIMSEYTMGAILSHSTRLVENIENQRKRTWKKFQCVDSLLGKTLLIVGAGRTGQLIAAKGKAFGMNVIGVKKHAGILPDFDKIITLDDLETILLLADFVVCTIPLTDETKGMIDLHKFEQMKNTSYFINISRSRIVVTEDLKKALMDGKIAGACIDVFDKEPLDADDELWDIPNLIVTPHSSGRLENFTDKTIPYFIKNLNAFNAGNALPDNVNLHEGY